MTILIDPDSGWKFGFPKPAPQEFYTLGNDFDLQEWLEDNGWPKGREPLYVRYVEVSDARS